MDIQKKNHSIQFLVFCTIFFDFLGFGILIPVIPLLLADPTSSYYMLPLGYSAKTGFILLGLLTATFPLGQFLTTPLFGQWSDKWGRKKLLALSTLGSAVSYVLFAWGIMIGNIPLLFISRFFDGLTGGNIAIAQAIITDITSSHKKTNGFGILGAAFGLGFILGPFFGGYMSDQSLVSWFNASTPFLMAGVLAALNTLFVLWVLPETHLQNLTQKKINLSQSFSNIKKVLKNHHLRPLYASAFFFHSGFAFFTTFISVFLINRFSFTQIHIGNFFAFVGIWVAISQIALIRIISKYLKPISMMQIGMMGVTVMLCAYFIPDTSTGLYMIVPLFALFFSLVQTNMLTLISNSVPNDIQGEILGINASVVALSQALPAIASGFIASYYLEPIHYHRCVVNNCVHIC